MFAVPFSHEFRNLMEWKLNTDGVNEIINLGNRKSYLVDLDGIFNTQLSLDSIKEWSLTK